MSSIWIVEDDPIQLKALKSVLEKLNFNVFGFSNATSLFDAIENETLKNCEAAYIDLALGDTLNGFQVAERLVDEFGIETSRIIFITGWKSQSEKLRPAEFVDNIIIDKANWTKEELLKAVESVHNHSEDGND